MNSTTLRKEAERLLRGAGAKVVRRTESHTIWQLNSYRYLTPRHRTVYTSGKLLLIKVKLFIKKARP